MHHDSQPNPEFAKKFKEYLEPVRKDRIDGLADMLGDQAREMELGATGQHSEGKLTPTDEGEIKIAVGHEQGKVVINFGKRIAWIGLSPRQARELAEAIRQHSYKASE